MSNHARRCFRFAKMLKCVVGFPILRDLVLRQVITWSQLFKNWMTLQWMTLQGCQPPPPLTSPVYRFPLDNAIDFPNTYPPDSALSGGWHYLNYWAELFKAGLR